ncbi:MAG TPA: hypothetical protein VH912_23965 [Streptosporangiaceae bacterium]|jgi:hypothetical protein
MDDDPEDIELEAELRQAAELLDPVPARLLRDAAQAYTFRTIDAELAELTFDSLAAEELVRGSDRPRLLTFQASTRTIEVEVAGAGDDRRLIGTISPAEPIPIDVRSRERVTTVTADELGRFQTGAGLGAGPYSLRCGDVVTDWFSA